MKTTSKAVAAREARAERKLFRAAHGCRWCGDADPAHVGRRFQKSRGSRAPGFTIDTMKCLNCEHTWTEILGDRKA